MKTLSRLLLGLAMVFAANSAGFATTPSTGSEIKENLFSAIRSIDYVSINVLLAEGADVDTVNETGNTPLMLASEIGNPRIVDILLAHKPNVNKQNKEGATSLIIAAKSGQSAIVSKLLKQGADKSITDQNGNTALTLASKFGHQKTVHLLTDSSGSPTR